VKQSGPLVSGAAYCISSCSMIILNKIVLSSYNFNAGVSLMLYQVRHFNPISWFP
jgi:GDP-mannose transporter